MMEVCNLKLPISKAIDEAKSERKEIIIKKRKIDYGDD